MPSRIALAALPLLLAAAPAFAHHPLGGMVPESLTRNSLKFCRPLRGVEL